MIFYERVRVCYRKLVLCDLMILFNCFIYVGVALTYQLYCGRVCPQTARDYPSLFLHFQT